MPLDRVDIAILETLQKDGRIPNAALAEKVGLSQSACSRRLDNLEKSGTIQRSIGRTDLPGGNTDQELDSIRTKLYTLDPETAVYPGHGDPTSIAEERAENPFVAG